MSKSFCTLVDHTGLHLFESPFDGVNWLQFTIHIVLTTPQLVIYYTHGRCHTHHPGHHCHSRGMVWWTLGTHQRGTHCISWTWSRHQRDSQVHAVDHCHQSHGHQSRPKRQYGIRCRCQYRCQYRWCQYASTVGFVSRTRVFRRHRLRSERACRLCPEGSKRWCCNRSRSPAHASSQSPPTCSPTAPDWLWLWCSSFPLPAW